MEELNLTLPAQQATKRLLVDTNPDRIKHWLKSLPYADIERSQEQVVAALTHLNRTSVNNKARIDCMRCFLFSFNIISSFYRDAGNHSGAFTDQFLKLIREMSYGYKLIIKRQAQKKLKVFNNKKNEAANIALTLHFLGLLLIEHYQRYEPVPPHIWYELNQLYALAEKRKVENLILEPEITGIENTLTIKQAYMTICLCSVASPFQLSEGGHWQVYTYLQHYVKLVDLVKPQPDINENSEPSSQYKEVLHIDLSQHDKPQFVTAPFEASEHSRLFDTQKLLAEINKHREKLETATVCSIVGLPRSAQPQDVNVFLKTIFKGWKGITKRSQPRYEKSLQLELRCHLQEVIHSIKMSDPAYFSDSHSESDIENNILSHAPGIRWEMINAAEGGLCVQRASTKQAEDFVVGQLVALRECVGNDSGQDWSLAIVRWQRHHQGKSLGLEYVRGQHQAVNIVQTFATPEDTISIPSLLIKAGKYGMSPYAIITRRGLCRVDTEFTIEIADEKFCARADQLIERTIYFDLFAIQFDQSKTI